MPQATVCREPDPSAFLHDPAAAVICARIGSTRKIRPLAYLDDLKTLALRHCRPDGTTAIDRLTLRRIDEPSARIGAVYQPSFCLVLQGAKTTFLGPHAFSYKAGEYLIASVEVPVTGQVSQASPEAPYLSIRLDLDGAVIATMLLEAREAGRAARGGGPLRVIAADDAVLDPMTRLMRLLDHPADIPALAPLFEREIVYRLVADDATGLLHQMSLKDSVASRINSAIGWLHQRYAEPFRIETIAAQAHMSASAFHRHFKAMTSLSPLQYQKHLRLQEARRLLLARQHDVGAIGLRVGYESQSQFSREYLRLFGTPPGRDGVYLRSLAAGAFEAA